MQLTSLTVNAYHGTPSSFTLDQIKLDPWPHTTNDRKVSLGAYFTSNKELASLYGQVLEARLMFNNLVDLRGFDGIQDARVFYRSLPAEIPDRLACEVSAGYSGALDAYHLLETALGRCDLINQLKGAGCDGIAFREAYSDVFVPLLRSSIYSRKK